MFEVGRTYFVRGVTYIVGRLVDVTPEELVFEQASWVADTGRFGAAMADGEFSEVEVYPPDRKVIVNRRNYFDAVEWGGELPTASK